MSLKHPEVWLAVQTGRSILILGEPGITKTYTARAFAANKRIDREFESIVPSQRDPADIVGYPHIGDVIINGKTRKVAQFVPAEWRVRLEESPKGGFLLLDEILDCSPAHQAAIQQVLNDGVPNCWILGCGNPAAISTNGYDLAPAVVNRLCVLTYEAPVDEWKDNLIADFQTSEDHFPVLPANWRDKVFESRALVRAFLDKRPDLAQKLPREAVNQGQPWPSLRSWTNATEMMAASLAYESRKLGNGEGLSSMAEKLVTGCIGKAAANEFFAWQSKLDLPDLKDVLDEPETVDWHSRGDRVWAILAGVVSHALQHKTKQAWESAENVFVVAAKSKKAIAYAAYLAICKTDRIPQGCQFSAAARKTFMSLAKSMSS